MGYKDGIISNKQVPTSQSIIALVSLCEPAGIVSCTDLHQWGIECRCLAGNFHKVIHGPLKYHAEEDGEESWCEDPALLHSFDDWEIFREVVGVSDLITLIFMQQDDHAEKVGGI